MIKITELNEIINVLEQSTLDEFSIKVKETEIHMKKNNRSNQQGDLQESLKKAKEFKIEKSKELLNKGEETSETVKFNKGKQECLISSPIVGTVYLSPSPESNTYVEVGDMVGVGTIVCNVEAMKLFNEVEAEVIGEVLEIMVEDGDMVDYGQPLFKLKTE